MEILVTFIIFAVLIWGIIRKIDLRTLLLFEMICILAYLTFVNGSVLGEASSGNAVIDCFAYIASYISSNLGGTVFSILIVSAYVETMNHLKATNKLAAIIGAPLKKVSNPYIVTALVMIIGCLLRTCITSGPAAVILLIATFLPVMLECGCSLLMACTAILICNAICWGPADPINLAAANLMGIEVNLAEWFVVYQLPVVVIVFIVMIAVYILLNVISKKDIVKNVPSAGEEHSYDKIPAIYALMPIFPLIMMLVFSPFFISTITLDINTACIFSLIIVIVLAVLCEKSFTPITVLLQKFFSAFADCLNGLGMTILLAMMFSATLNKVGAMQIIAEFLMRLNVPSVVLIVLICVFAGFINIVVGSFIGALSISEPIAATVAAATGISAPLICFLVVISCGAGCVCSPVNPMVLILSKKVDAFQMIRKGAAAIWCGVIAAIIISCIFLG